VESLLNETQRFLFVFFILSACATAAVLALHVLRLRHKVLWAFSFAIMSSGGILWLLSNAVRLLSDMVEVWKFSTNTGGMGISMATFGLMTFSVQVSSRVRKIPRLLWAFLPMLVICSVLSWTNDLHHLVWSEWPAPGQAAGQPGLVLILFLCVIYTQILVALSALVRSYLTKDSIFRVQTGFLLAGVILPVAAALAEDLLNLKFLPGVDAAALATMVTIGIFALVTLRYGTFSVIPVAYKMMVDAMQEGMIVLDLENHVLSYNPAALKFFGNPQPARVGMPFDEVLAGWSAEAHASWTAGKLDFDVVLSGEAIRSYRLAVQDLVENHAESAGKMVIIYDITRQKQLESSLHEMAINDPLTGCFNRTHFLECAGKQFRQALRYHRPLSVAMIDLDHFKQVNDDFGHATGDRVLKRVVAACMATLRRSDIFARYGGEEFMVMMPETGASDALLVAERLREAISGQFLQGATVTASIGVAWLDPEEEIDLERLLERADQAQYRSKGLGRDRVTLWKK
jgi:diguanylate cyclase (GGDEF)-like protein